MLSTLLLLHILIRRAHQCTVTRKKELYSEVKLVLCMENLHQWEDKACLVQLQVWLKLKTSCLRSEKGGHEDAEQVIGLNLLQRPSTARKETQKCFN